MARITVSLGEDVYLFIHKRWNKNHEFRNASHFVESCVRQVMDEESKEPPAKTT